MSVVAPHAGAWIEMGDWQFVKVEGVVAPHAGAWIEITKLNILHLAPRSPLTQGRGLKFCHT